MSTSKTIIIPVLLAATVVAACTVQEQNAPPFSGPSELALRIALQAIPDSILQDGFSQAAVSIDASGVDGRPVRGLALRVEIVEGGVIYDFGTLSAKTVVTGEDGRARVIYTAPPREVGASGDGRLVTLLVTPISNDYRGDIARTVDIRLVPVGVILPPNEAPTAQFTFTPDTPAAFQTVTFDASTSTDDGGVRCGNACTYAWDFGDGTTGTGIFTTHQYRTVGAFQVRLTVTDQRGASAQQAQTITVGASEAPVASFTFSPSANIAVGQTISFTAAASTAAPGRRIVSYDWDFGSGRTASGVTVSKGYETAGTYVVTLTVTDDVGRTSVVTRDVIVGAGGVVTARLIVSPNPGDTSTNFVFDARTTTAGSSPIVEYRFRFGDGTPDVVGASATTTHRYSANGTYIATVTIRDSANATFTSATVAVVVGRDLQARLTVTPTTGNVATNFFFDARGSTPGPGSFITTYHFVFGDGTSTPVGSTSPTATHTYTTPGTYTATVTITVGGGTEGSTAVVIVTVTPP